MKASMRFDLVDLRLFLFVVQAASITHGAARAGMVLASASEQIRLMKETLGAALLAAWPTPHKVIGEPVLFCVSRCKERRN